MAKRYRLKEAEQEHGKMEKTIPMLVNRLGSQKAAAEALGVSQATISMWLLKHGYQPQTVYVKKGEKAC